MPDTLPTAPRWRTADDARSEGWTVAVHNDYRLGGTAYTFWLFTHPCGLWAKGEGPTDGDALWAACGDARARMQDRSEAIEERRELRNTIAELRRQLEGTVRPDACPRCGMSGRLACPDAGCIHREG